MKEMIKKYDLDKMVKVVTDRAYGYSDIKEEYEEKFKGEMKTNSDKCYEFGYGSTLDDVINLLTDLKHYLKTKLTKEQKDYFVAQYLDADLDNCLSYSDVDKVRYFRTTNADEIKAFLINEASAYEYAEDIIEGFDMQFIESLNPNIEKQEEITLVNDFDKNNIKIFKIDKNELLKHVDVNFIEDVIRTGDYILESAGSGYHEDSETLKRVLDIMKVDYKVKM